MFADCHAFSDFETGLCDWVQLNDDQYQWRRHTGNTGSVNTGPSTDASGNGEHSQRIALVI